MSQDAEQPRSRRDLRRAQLSASSIEAGVPEYPSVPLLPGAIENNVIEGQPEMSQESPPNDSVRRPHGSHAAATLHDVPAAQPPVRSRRAQPSSRQALRAEEKARAAAEAPVPEATVLDAPGSLDAPASGDTAEASVQTTVMNSRRALSTPADAPTQQRVERRSEIRARDRAALRALREVTEPAGPEEPLPSRRLLRQQQIEAERAPATNPQQVLASSSGAAAEVAAAQASLGTPASELNSAAQVEQTPSIAEALAERDRQALFDDARSHAESLPVGADPLAVDLEVLAEQKALAERAAILNERAQARARLAEESAEARQKLNDPTAAHNLAMVTPLQFVKVPGVERPVLQAPATSHVPVVTRSNPAMPRAIRPPSTPPRSMPVVPAAAPSSAANSSGEATSSGAEELAVRGRAQVLRRAEQAARVRPGRAAAVSAQSTTTALSEGETAPMPAKSAYGLEPLDALTAGLGRAQRNRFLLWGGIVVGLGALIAGLSMIITSMAR